MHWTSVFTDLLQQPGVRLAGSMISCEVAAQGGDLSGARRTNPHVLPHAWATDAATLRALRDAGAFKCRADPWETRWHSDLGASKAVLDAGGNLASLLGPQRGVDWRNRTNWHCNGRVAPDRQGTYDGLTVSPYEAVFWPIGLAQAENYAALRVGGRYAMWSMVRRGGVDWGVGGWWARMAIMFAQMALNALERLLGHMSLGPPSPPRRDRQT